MVVTGRTFLKDDVEIDETFVCGKEKNRPIN